MSIKRSRWDSDEEDNSERVSKSVRISKTKERSRQPEQVVGKVGSDNIVAESDVANVESELVVPQKEPQIVERVKTHIPLIHGCRSVDIYTRLNYIDEGTYGMVFRARCSETNDIVALKQVKLGRNESKVGFPITALREINILLSLKHPNIVNVREMVVGSSTDKVFMVMEYLENDLKSCMETTKTPFSISEVSASSVNI